MLDIFTATNTKFKKIKYKFKILQAPINFITNNQFKNTKYNFRTMKLQREFAFSLSLKTSNIGFMIRCVSFFLKMFVLIADITFHYSFKISYKSLKQCSGKNYNTTSHNAKYKFAVLIIFAIKATLRVLKCQI